LRVLLISFWWYRNAAKRREWGCFNFEQGSILSILAWISSIAVWISALRKVLVIYLSSYVKVFNRKEVEVNLPKCTEDAVRIFNTIEKCIELLNVTVAGRYLKPIQW
jgi:hypothetical protein